MLEDRRTAAKSKDGYIERPVKHRRKFEQIAAQKYDEGEYRAEVSVLVVTSRNPTWPWHCHDVCPSDAHKGRDLLSDEV